MSKHEAEQFTLLPEADLKNASSNEVWKRREVDRLLDLYLEGADLGRIASKLTRNRKAIVRKLQEYIYNERDRVVNYKPKRRISRKEKRITPNEKQIITECRKKDVAWDCIASVLMRDTSEINPDAMMEQINTARRVSQGKEISTSIDLLLAYRYCYYVKGISIVTDEAYDTLEKEEIEYGGAGKILKEGPSSDREDDYPPRIRALGMYLIFKFAEREKEKRR